MGVWVYGGGCDRTCFGRMKARISTCRSERVRDRGREQGWEREGQDGRAGARERWGNGGMERDKVSKIGSERERDGCLRRGGVGGGMGRQRRDKECVRKHL